MNEKPIIVVVGGQWGSEAKGMVAASLCLNKKVDFAVRTGAVNAGHTVYYKGKPYKMQQLPTGWVNPGTKLVIGAGAYVNPEILYNELDMIACATGEGMARIIKRTYVDFRCGLHLDRHTNESAVANRHHKIGATGKGCSAAIVDKIVNRGNGAMTLYDWWNKVHRTYRMEFNWEPQWFDTEALLNGAYDGGARILLEGTQGDLLDLHLGPYPYVTHKQCGPAQWLMECGLSPNLEYEIALVLRTYPIRVAGNSGPMPLETGWIEVAASIDRRREALGLPRIVKEESLMTWSDVCMELAEELATEGQMPMKHGLAHWGFNRWTPEMRVQYQWTLSEFHKLALERLQPETVADLSKVFEFTTVTKKLRRVANFHPQTVESVIRRNRPSYIVLTFLNYLYSELWNQTEINETGGQWLSHLEKMFEVPIKYTSTGPEHQHLIDVSL